MGRLQEKIMFTIDKGIEIPKRNRRGPVTKYPFGEMNVGDSIRVPRSLYKKTYNAAWAHGRVHNQKFSARRQSKTIYRIWRIE
jgi:hypothetical protein